MKRRFTEDLIINILKEQEAGFRLRRSPTATGLYGVGCDLNFHRTLHPLHKG